MVMYYGKVAVLSRCVIVLEHHPSLLTTSRLEEHQFRANIT